MKKLIENVEYILKWYPETRDNDKLLYYTLITRLYNACELYDIVREDMPNSASVTRMRRWLKDKYPPTDDDKRKEKEAEYVYFFGK